MELRREYHCHAYNMLAAIISCTQNKQQFYTAFLFKEDTSKGQLLWDNLIDCTKIYTFETQLEVMAKCWSHCCVIASYCIGSHE